MENKHIEVKNGVGNIEHMYGDNKYITNYIDTNDLADKIWNKVNPLLELEDKEKEIEQLKKIISKLDGSKQDQEIQYYLEAGDYIEAARLLEKSVTIDIERLIEDTEKIFNKEISFITATSLYSFDKSIQLIEKKLIKYSNKNINIIRLILTYADILLLYGQLEKALNKFKSIKLLCAYKIHFLEYDVNTKQQKIGISKSDGTQIEDIHNFNLDDDENYLDFIISIQTLFFSSIGQANCYSSLGFYPLATNLYVKALKYAVILNDDDFINNCKSSIAYMNYVQGKYDDAIKQYDVTDDNKDEAIEKYLVLVFIYISKNDNHNLEKTITKYKKVFKYLKENSLTIGLREGSYYNALGAYYEFLKEYDKAEEYLLKSIECYKKNKQLSAVCNVSLHIANFYHNQNKEDEANDYYGRIIKLAKEHNFLSILSRAIHNQALMEKHIYAAISKFKKAMYLNKYIEKPLSLATNLCMIADRYRTLKKFKKAKKYIKNAYNIYKKEKHTKMMHYDAYYDILKLDSKELEDYFSLLKLSARCDNCYKKYDAYMNLGIYYTKSYNVGMALKSFKRAEEKISKCTTCTNIDKFDTYIHLCQIYLNIFKYKEFNTYLEKAKKVANEKREDTVVELFEMLLSIRQKNIKSIFDKADAISLKFNLLNNQDIRIFFHELHPFITEERRYGSAITYADRFISILSKKNTKDILQVEANILSYICQWYASYTVETKDLKIWLKATGYLMIISDYFSRHIEQNEENYFYTIVSYLSLSTLSTIVGNDKDALIIYQKIFDESFMTDEIWQKEPFLQNKKSYFAGMVNYANCLRKSKKYELSIQILNKNIRLLKNTTDFEHLELSYSNLAMTYELSNKYSLAKENFLSALEIAKKENNTFAIAHAYEHLGLVYKKLEDFQKSITYLKKSVYSYRKCSSDDDADRVQKLILER